MKILALAAALAAAQPAAAQTAESVPELRIVCCWTIPPDGDGVGRIVRSAKDLGFNALGWSGPSHGREIAAECHKNGMTAYKVLEPLRIRTGAVAQVMAPEDDQLPGAANIPDGHPFQYGGEPVAGRPEVLDRPLACPCDPGIADYAASLVGQAKEEGFDGICWDFIGYRNYHSCRCPLCRAGLEEFRRGHPGMPPEESEDRFYEDNLVELYAKLYAVAKAAAPGVKVMCHVHPAFLPDPFYGRRLAVDYCGVTVAWFFRPPWPMTKVAEYTGKAVAGPYSRPGAGGMPMIGYYGGKDSRGGTRLAEELDIVIKSGAKAVMLCELGDLSRDPAAAAALRSAFVNSAQTAESVPPAAPPPPEVLRIVVSEWPPYIFVAGNGGIVGIDAEKVREMCRRAGFGVEIHVMPWERCLLAMRDGAADALFSPRKRAGREAYMSFDIPLGIERPAVFALKSKGVKAGHLADLERYSIGVVRGYVYNPEFDQVKWRVKHEVDEDAQLLPMLINGRMDLAVFSDETTMLYTARCQGVADQIEPVLHMADEWNYLALSRKALGPSRRAELAARCNRALESMRADGTIKAIEAKYLTPE